MWAEARAGLESEFCVSVFKAKGSPPLRDIGRVLYVVIPRKQLQ